MNVQLGQLIVWVITGALAGFMAGRIFKGKGFGLIGSFIVGLLGALLGGALFQLLGINVSLPGLDNLTFSVSDLITAFVGAVILILVIQFLQRRQR